MSLFAHVGVPHVALSDRLFRSCFLTIELKRHTIQTSYRIRRVRLCVVLCVGLVGVGPTQAQVPHRRSLRAHIYARVHSMSWTNARPTGGSYVRGSPAVGFLASEKNTPLSAVLPGLESDAPLLPASGFLTHWCHFHATFPTQCLPLWHHFATPSARGMRATGGTAPSLATL